MLSSTKLSARGSTLGAYDELQLANVDNASCVFSGNCPYDFNSDGAINSGDLLVFLGVFGSTCEP